MFVREHIHIGRPFEVVAPHFVSDTSWLAPIAEEAAAVAHEVARSLAPDGPVPSEPVDAADHPRRTIRLEVGPVRAHARGILVPMWLIGAERDRGLPDLTGDLEVAAAGADCSLIALGATYDRANRHREELRRVERATEAGVRSFLGGIAEALGGPAAHA